MTHSLYLDALRRDQCGKHVVDVCKDDDWQEVEVMRNCVGDPGDTSAGDHGPVFTDCCQSVWVRGSCSGAESKDTNSTSSSQLQHWDSYLVSGPDDLLTLNTLTLTLAWNNIRMELFDTGKMENISFSTNLVFEGEWKNNFTALQAMMKVYNQINNQHLPLKCNVLFLCFFLINLSEIIAFLLCQSFMRLKYVIFMTPWTKRVDCLHVCESRFCFSTCLYNSAVSAALIHCQGSTIVLHGNTGRSHGIHCPIVRHRSGGGRGGRVEQRNLFR